MIEENWEDVTLYKVYATDSFDDINENVNSFLFNSELGKKDIFKILISYYENKYKEEQIIIEEIDDGLQLLCK